MELIKKLKKGNFELTHERYFDEMGMERDAFDLFNIKDRVHLPFMGMIKSVPAKYARTYRSINDYTLKEYRQMMNEQIEKYDAYKNKT
jgi:hypothetical protein